MITKDEIRCECGRFYPRAGACLACTPEPASEAAEGKEIELIPGQVAVPFFKTEKEHQEFREWWSQNVTEALKRQADKVREAEAQCEQLKRERDEVWMHTCVHHADAERLEASQKCPVCLLAENGRAIDFCIGLTGKKPDEICDVFKERDQLRADASRLEKECAEHKQAVIDAMALSNDMDAQYRRHLQKIKELVERILREPFAPDNQVTPVETFAREIARLAIRREWR